MSERPASADSGNKGSSKLQLTKNIETTGTEAP
jgi:hypothetical protein